MLLTQEPTKQQFFKQKSIFNISFFNYFMANRIVDIFKQASTNKIVAYTISRYIIYGIQFIVSMLCAAKMGPYYYGVWGFILMLLNYMQRIDLGVPNAMNIILVQEKDSKEEFSRTQTTGFLLLSVLSVGILVFALGNVVWGYEFMKKYPIGPLFYIICIVAIISYYVTACTGVYRVKHKLLEIALVQSIIPMLLLIMLFIVDGKDLLIWFTLAYLIGNIVSLFVYLFKGELTLKVHPSRAMAKRMLVKGIYLFLYNASFYFIMISTRTIVSANYPVEQFGFFTFAYSLADAVILLLGAFTFLMFPKLMAKLNTTDMQQVKNTINQLRNNYIPLVHIMMYVAFLFFPVLVFVFPKYEPALPAMYMVGLTLIMETSGSGYGDYLMAQNKESQMAFVSIICLIVNVGLSVFLVKIINCSYAFVMFATLFSYWLFSILFVILGIKKMGAKPTVVCVLKEVVPFRLVIPYASSAVLFVIPSLWVLPIPLIVFIVFNYLTIKELYGTFRRVLSNPNMLDVEGV